MKEFDNRPLASKLAGSAFLLGLLVGIPAVSQEPIPDAQAETATPEAAGPCPEGTDRFQQCRQFTGDGEFTVPEGVYRVTVVGCGGGGGGGAGSGIIDLVSLGGGGGAGASLVHLTLAARPGDKLTVKIGRGGAGGGAGERAGTSGGTGQSGDPSLFGSLTFPGGAGGEGGRVERTRSSNTGVFNGRLEIQAARGGSGSVGSFSGGDGSRGGQDRQGGPGVGSPFARGGNPGPVADARMVFTGSGGGGGASRGPGGDGGQASEQPTGGGAAGANTCAGGGGGGGGYRGPGIAGGAGGSGFIEVYWDQPVAHHDMLLQEINRLIKELPQGILAEEVLRALEARLEQRLRHELTTEIEKIRQSLRGDPTELKEQ